MSTRQRGRIDQYSGRSVVHGLYCQRIFSPCNSVTTACTLEPRIPTHAPTGSIVLSDEQTAIFALDPGSLATDLISIILSLISGTSCLNKLAKN